jgi:5'(3')-deoxyribonucleotidase
VLIYRGVRTKWGYSKLIIVGVDIDGVLAEQVDHTLKWLKNKKGINLKVNQKEDINKWDEEIAPGLTFDKAIEELFKEDEFFVQEMPVIIGSAKNMEEIYRKYHIVIASSRPPESERATKVWLSKHFKDKYHEYVNTHQIGKHNLGLHVLIDDNIENIKKFCEHGGEFAIIFDQPWNRQIDAEIQQLIKDGKVIRCKSWDDIPKVLDSFRIRI